MFKYSKLHMDLDFKVILLRSKAKVGLLALITLVSMVLGMMAIPTATVKADYGVAANANPYVTPFGFSIDSIKVQRGDTISFSYDCNVIDSYVTYKDIYSQTVGSGYAITNPSYQWDGNVSTYAELEHSAAKAANHVNAGPAALEIITFDYTEKFDSIKLQFWNGTSDPAAALPDAYCAIKWVYTQFDDSRNLAVQRTIWSHAYNDTALDIRPIFGYRCVMEGKKDPVYADQMELWFNISYNNHLTIFIADKNLHRGACTVMPFAFQCLQVTSAQYTGAAFSPLDTWSLKVTNTGEGHNSVQVTVPSDMAGREVLLFCTNEYNAYNTAANGAYGQFWNDSTDFYVNDLVSTSSTTQFYYISGVDIIIENPAAKTFPYQFEVLIGLMAIGLFGVSDGCIHWSKKKGLHGAMNGKLLLTGIVTGVACAIVTFIFFWGIFDYYGWFGVSNFPWSVGLIGLGGFALRGKPRPCSFRKLRYIMPVALVCMLSVSCMNVQAISYRYQVGTVWMENIAFESKRGDSFTVNMRAIGFCQDANITLVDYSTNLTENVYLEMEYNGEERDIYVAFNFEAKVINRTDLKFIVDVPTNAKYSEGAIYTGYIYGFGMDLQNDNGNLNIQAQQGSHPMIRQDNRSFYGAFTLTIKEDVNWTYNSWMVLAIIILWGAAAGMHFYFVRKYSKNQRKKMLVDNVLVLLPILAGFGLCLALLFGIWYNIGYKIPGTDFPVIRFVISKMAALLTVF